MDPILKAWATRYYFTGIGRDESEDYNVENGLDEEVLNNTYKSEFLEPLQKMTGGSNTPQEIRQALMTFGTVNCTVWPYVLNYWIQEGYFKPGVDEFNSTSLSACVSKFTKDHKLLYATTGYKYKDFVVFANKQNKAVGKFPARVFCYIGVNSHKGGQALLDLSRKAPLSLTNSQCILLQKAVTFKMIPEEELKHDDVQIPEANGNIKIMSACACTPDLPPAEVNNLINAMGPAYISEFPSVYFALRDYVADKQHDQVIDKYLEKISDHFVLGAKVTEKDKLSNLDDATVSAYLEQRCGKNTDGESNGDLDGVYVGTLDDAVAEYCKAENIDPRCTIEQLINYINYDIKIEPQTTEINAASVANWIKSSGKFDAEFADLLANMIENDNEKNVSLVDCVDPEEVAIKYVQDAKNIDADAKSYIVTAIKEGCEAPSASEVRSNELAIVEDYLGRLGLPDKFLLAMSNSLKQGKKLATNAYTFVSNVASDKDGKELLRSALAKINVPKGLENAIISAFEANKTVELPTAFEEKHDPLLQEPGYLSGEYLLRKTREKLNVDSSFEVREQYVNILHCFLRLLMGDFKTDKDGIVSTLQEYQKSSSAEVANVIAEALKLI